MNKLTKLRIYTNKDHKARPKPRLFFAASLIDDNLRHSNPFVPRLKISLKELSSIFYRLYIDRQTRLRISLKSVFTPQNCTPPSFSTRSLLSSSTSSSFSLFNLSASASFSIAIACASYIFITASSAIFRPQNICLRIRGTREKIN